MPHLRSLQRAKSAPSTSPKGRGAHALAGLLLGLAAVAGAAQPAAALPRQNPKACIGQPQIAPLQALELRTASGRHKFQVEVAATPLSREYGLMCRTSLAPDRGMLFVFERAGDQAFWMRNTLIPLDIVYIGSNGRVVSITRNAQPLDETPLPSNGPARYVLELAGGRAAELGLLPGDRVLHRSMPRG